MRYPKLVFFENIELLLIIKVLKDIPKTIYIVMLPFSE